MQLPKALLLLSVVVCPSLVMAQPDDVVPTVQNEKPHMLTLDNVRPWAMAWWLDPANNRVPAVFYFNRDPQASYAGAIPHTLLKGPVESPVKKPQKPLPQKGVEQFPGVQMIVGIDAQNVLVVLGTAEGFAKVQVEVAKMDVPPQEVPVQLGFLENGRHDYWRTGR